MDAPCILEFCSITPNITANHQTSSNGPPTIPIIASARGTKRDFNSRKPSNKSHTAGIKPPPRKKIRSYRVTSAWPVTNESAPAPACRKLTIVKMNDTPTRRPADSKIRAAKSASDADSLTFFSIGNRTTAVPIPANAIVTSNVAPISADVSGPEPTM